MRFHVSSISESSPFILFYLYVPFLRAHNQICVVHVQILCSQPMLVLESLSECELRAPSFSSPESIPPLEILIVVPDHDRLPLSRAHLLWSSLSPLRKLLLFLFLFLLAYLLSPPQIPFPSLPLVIGHWQCFGVSLLTLSDQGCSELEQ